MRTEERIAVTALALVCGTAAGVGALPVQQEKPQNLELVSAVGCLNQGSEPDSWVLTHASEPAAASDAFTSRQELTEAAETPLGSMRYALLGVGEFNVAPHTGHKVQAKGLLIIAGEERRLNVTSFQHLAPTCP